MGDDDDDDDDDHDDLTSYHFAWLLGVRTIF